MPSNGFSSTKLDGFSFNVIEMPEQFNYRKNIKLFNTSPMMSKMFNAISEPIELKNNCVVDYLFHEYKKINTKVNINIIKKRLGEFVNIDNGVNIDAFEKYMNKYNKHIRYTVIGPNFDCISQYKPNYSYELHLTFYVNNSHLYPITSIPVQQYIATKLTKNPKFNFYNYFEELNHELPNQYKYMEKYDPAEEEENIIYIINKDIDINKFCIDLITEFNYVVEYIDLNYKTSSIQLFKHPIKNIYYSAYDDYHKRKAICEKLNNKYQNQFIKFNNQSFSTIAKKLLKFHTDIPQSTYLQHTFNMLEQFEPKPIVEIIESCNTTDLKTIDYAKHYSTIFYNDFKKINIPIYDIHNVIEKYDGHDLNDKHGEYFIKQKKIHGIKLFGCFIISQMVKWLLHKKIITNDDITHCITTENFFTTDAFEKFVLDTNDLNDEDQFKKLNNILNGSLKNSKHITTKTTFTNDITSMIYMLNEGMAKNKKINWHYDENTGYHFIKTTSEKNKQVNNTVLYRCTLSLSMKYTIQLINKCAKKGKIIKVLTDSCTYRPFDENDFVKENYNYKKNIIDNLGKYKHEFNDIYDLVKYTPVDKIFNLEKYEYKDEYIKGAGGLGKTYSTILRLQESHLDKKVLFTAFTNSAALNLQNNIINICDSIPNTWKVNTLTRITMFKKNNQNKYKNPFLNYELIVVDEIITCPHRLLRKLLLSDVKKIFLGDSCQNQQIFQYFQSEYDVGDFLEKHCITTEKEFVEGKSRYNKKTYKLLEEIRQSGSIKQVIKNVSTIKKNKMYKYNIARSNKTVKRLNKECCDYYHKKEKELEFNIIIEQYDDEENELMIKEKKEQKTKPVIRYKVGKGCPIICSVKNKNLRSDYALDNGWTGEVVNINYNDETPSIDIYGIIFDGSEFSEECINISLSVFTSHFEPAYAITCYKAQGKTIKGDLAVHDLEYGFFNDSCYVYTALSRTSDIKNIHISKNKKLCTKFKKWNAAKKYYKVCDDKSVHVIKYMNDKKKQDGYLPGVLMKNKVYKITVYKIIDKSKPDFYSYEINTPDADSTLEISKSIDLTGTKEQINNKLEVLNSHKNILKQNKYIVHTFKPLLIQTSNTSKIQIYKNSVKCTYYNAEEDKKEIKRLKVTKTRTLEQTFNKMKELYPDVNTFEDKKRYILSFA
jgi:hypothetical protein